MKLNLNILVCCLTAVLIFSILGWIYQTRTRAYDAINVTGSATKDFPSDIIVWEGDFLQRNLDLKAAYAALDNDHKLVAQFLKSKGIAETDIVFSAINIEKLFEEQYSENGNVMSKTFVGYLLMQSVRIESKEVDKVETSSREITQLINQGIEFQSHEPEYYYSKLSELKIDMIAEATKDGHLRAEQIAKNSSAFLGHLTDSNLGVFQILAPNSSEEISWDGAFNRSSKIKRAIITVKLRFGIAN